MLSLFLERCPPLALAGSGIALNFAPEGMIYNKIKDNPKLQFVALDIDMAQYGEPLRPGITSDLHAIPLKDATACVLFCLHVLEHVRDDRACIHELHRVLQPGGEAVIMVPFMMGQTETEEYPAPDPEMWDHVRGYSPRDFKHRLAPFAYEEIYPRTFLTEEEVKRFAIPDSQVIYICKKT